MKIKNLFRRGAAPPTEKPNNQELTSAHPCDVKPQMVNINDVSVLTQRRQGLRAAVSLFYYYKDHMDELNSVKIPKAELAAVFGVEKRTVKNWVKALSDVGAIKYKYSGSVRLNPKICFSGSQENFNKAVIEYDRFNGDL